MSTDVHAILELKLLGRWHYYAALNLGQSYQLFSKMAGVRGSEAPMVPPRGLPADAADLTRFVAEHTVDNHTHSWFGVDEMQLLDQWYQNQEWRRGSPYTRPHLENVYLFGNDIESWWRWPGDRPEGVNDIRMVFWFR